MIHGNRGEYVLGVIGILGALVFTGVAYIVANSLISSFGWNLGICVGIGILSGSMSVVGVYAFIAKAVNWVTKEG